MIKKFLVFTSMFIISFSFNTEAYSSNDHHESPDGHGNNKIGPGKAILEVDSKKGFKLSPEAFKTLEIKTKSISLATDIPQDAYVLVKDKKGVYILRNGFFRFVVVSPNMDLKIDDQIVVNGAELLTITDVYSTDESEYSH